MKDRTSKRIATTRGTAAAGPRRALVACAAAVALALTWSACSEQMTNPTGQPTPTPTPEPTDPGSSVATERAALVALYNATDGPNWKQKGRWLTDAAVGQWHGVVTDSAGKVLWLMLSDNGLKGSLVPQLGDLKSLQYLGLADNQLSGELPPKLGSAARLTGLWIDDNRLTGVVPNTFLELKRLRVFDFNRNGGLCRPANASFSQWAGTVPQISGPDCSAADANVLRALHAGTGGSNWTTSTGWLSSMGLGDWHGVTVDSVGRVTGLGLNSNGLAGSLPAAVGDLSALKRLNVADNSGLTGTLPQSLTRLSLDELRYNGTKLCASADSAFQKWLGGISQHAGSDQACPKQPERDLLVAIYNATDGKNWMNSDKWLTDAPIGEWQGVTTNDDGRVTGLDLSNNFQGNGLAGRFPAELGSLSELRMLNLIGNWRLIGPLPDEFFGLSKLETLLIAQVGLGGPLPAEIGRLTGLTELDASASGLGGPLPPEIGQLTNMVSLSLAENQLVGPMPAEMGRLANLQLLLLSGNSLTGEIPAGLGSTMLFELDLSRNELSGSIPSELGGLTQIEALALGNNRLTGPIPAGLGGAAGLTNLQLHSNRLSGGLPAELGRLTELRQLWVGDNAGLAGNIPDALTSLRNLKTFKAGRTGLCAPDSSGLLTWLDGIEFQRVARCGDGASVYLTQAVQSRTHPVPLIAGRPALLRAFITASEKTEQLMPAARATFYRGGSAVHAADIPAGSAAIPTEVDESDMAGSANLAVAGDVIQPGLELVVEVRLDSAVAASLQIPTRIPATGRMRLDVRAMPAMNLTVVPFLLQSRPDSAILGITTGMAESPTTHPMLRETRTLLPIGPLNVRRHAPVIVDSNDGFLILQRTEAMRMMEGRTGYWLAMMSPIPTGGLLGVATDIPSWSSFSVPSSSTVAHELGHNMGLFHASCGGTAGPDPLFPDRHGRIASWGYDHESRKLVSRYRPDIMTYCEGAWIGDYHFSNALRHRIDAERTSSSAIAPGAARVPTVLVWGGVDADGELYLEPSFAVDAAPIVPRPGTEYRLRAATETGREAFSFAFDMPDSQDDADGRTGFVFAVPVAWSGALDRITLERGSRSAQLTRGTNDPMTILRDPATGQIRAFLRGERTAAMGVPGQAGLEPIFSRGLPDAR